MSDQFTKDLVSVITPVYNSERFIKQTILSVVSQTYKNIEIVLVDDCSTDDSEKIIKNLAIIYQNIRYFKLPTNSGAAVARNAALKMAKGQYVAFLDSDDLWYPEKIEKQINLLATNKSGFGYTAIEMIDLDDKIVKKKRKVKEKITYRYLLKNTAIATSSVLIDRNIVGSFEMPNRRGGQDYATWLLLLRTQKIAYGINEALVKYRVGNKSSLSGKKTKSIKQVWEIQRKQEKINPICVWFNLHCFVFNAFKKYFF